MYEKMRKDVLPQLIPPYAKILIAVSGGPDSMALGHILWRYVHEERLRGISLVLTHVHHGVRKESDDELRMVQEIAKKWKIPCLIHCFDAKGYARTMGQSFQEAAREWRYARWKEDMHKEKCTLLATAHHLGDQAETILYRLFRGSGTAGLAGIYPSKSSIIRPLLSFLKSEILNYCAQQNLPYALDRSNEEPVYARNRIRLELLPELERNYNPRIQEALGRTGELLRWDEEYLAGQVGAAWERYLLSNSDGVVGLSREVFSETPAILSRLLRRMAMQVNEEPRGLAFKYIVAIMDSQGKSGWLQDLPGMRVEINDQGIWFHRCFQTRGGFRHSPTDEFAFKDYSIRGIGDEVQSSVEVNLSIGCWFEIPHINVKIGLVEDRQVGKNAVTINNEDKFACFDRDILDQFPEQLVFRNRRSGDKMWFQGVGHKSLKKVFQEENVSVDMRNWLPLIAAGNEVLWIPGVRQSDLCRADRSTIKVCCILKPLHIGSI